jgi:hypothetical protein
MTNDIGLTERTFITTGPSWVADFLIDTESITLDADLCLAVYTDGVVPSGAVIAQDTTTERYGPYAGSTEEVQTITEGGSGLTSYVLHALGADTAAVPAGATHDQVQAALEAASSIGEGNVLVTGSAGGPYQVQFVGDLANTDVPQMTATPTGGTGTVTITTGTPGGATTGSGGLQTPAGHLLGAKHVRAGHHVDGALYYKGRVYRDLLPDNSGIDDRAVAALTHIRYSKVGA